jgi:hypothetical protein
MLSRPPPRSQLTLDLAPHPPLPTPVIPPGAVAALAELLLAALGLTSEAGGGRDEPQDHR